MTRYLWTEYGYAAVRTIVRLTMWAVIWSAGAGLMYLCYLIGQNRMGR